MSMKRLFSIAEKKIVLRAVDLSRSGIHPQTISRAVRHGFLVKIDRGLYACQAFSQNYKRRVMVACQRVPHGVVCLESALRFHGVLPPTPDPIRLAIHRKARKPALQDLRLRFVRFSGQALTQGVVNIRIDGEPVRVYSVAKTIADCLKYRRKLESTVLSKAVDEGLRQTMCTRNRLLHFARICGVEDVLGVTQVKIRTLVKQHSEKAAK
jgi:predicted transcriptional regulator of viral defense system